MIKSILERKINLTNKNKKIQNKKIICVIGVPAHINEQTKTFAEKNKINYSINPEPSEFDKIVLVDCNNSQQLGRLEQKIISFKRNTEMQNSKTKDQNLIKNYNSQKKLIAVDHHELTQNSLAKGLIVEEAVSTTQVIYETFKEKLTPTEAYYCAVGIIEDTGRFIVGTKKAFECFSDCLNICNNSYTEIVSAHTQEMPISERIALLKSAQRLEFFATPKALVVFSEVSFYGSQSANALISLGADIAIVFSQENGFASISGRVSTQFKQNKKNNSTSFSLVRNLFSQVQAELGGSAGGHSSAAQWKGNVPISELKKKCKEILLRKLN
jgi:nanoRNase/pAp phosphatase (c-di-AMP/oligoRNAs hydrolase)